jgi:hypothetical protein
VATFSDQVDNGPVIFSLLKMIHTEVDEFGSTQSQPSKTASIAWSRFPRTFSISGACRSALACSAVSQFPSRTPTFFAPLTRRIPAANSGLRSPVSAASYARRRTAARRRLIVDGAKWRPSSSNLYRRTTVLLKASLGPEQYHVTKSSIANR